MSLDIKALRSARVIEDPEEAASLLVKRQGVGTHAQPSDRGIEIQKLVPGADLKA